MKNNANMSTLLMVLWAILMAFKDDLDVDVMNTIMQSIGAASGLSAGLGPLAAGRSEERRVGKECRSRWSPYH